MISLKIILFPALKSNTNGYERNMNQAAFRAVIESFKINTASKQSVKEKSEGGCGEVWINIPIETRMQWRCFNQIAWNYVSRWWNCKEEKLRFRSSCLTEQARKEEKLTAETKLIYSLHNFSKEKWFLSSIFDFIFSFGLHAEFGTWRCVAGWMFVRWLSEMKNFFIQNGRVEIWSLQSQ